MSSGEKKESTADIKRICLACGQTFINVTRCPKDNNPLVMIKRKDSMIGQVLGGCYEVHALLGRGGMSTVYKGRHKMMNRLVALKVLSSHDPYSLKRFHMEAQLAASLSHANIITVYDFGLAKDGEAYLAMDYIEGKTLAETIASGGPIDYKRAIVMFEQACDALAYAHSKGVIHRDLKPSNFLIALGPSGEDVIKLLDFGIAKQLEPGENYQTLTATGQVFGSPLYMSPEQCMGQKLDPRADVYSLGCVMYEVLTGRPPFIGKTPLDTMQMHVHEDATPPSQAGSQPVMPEKLEEIILKAVERDIERRYQSISELWNDLKKLEEDPGRLANSELDTAQIFVDKNGKEHVQTAYGRAETDSHMAYATADTDPNSVSMQQIQLKPSELENLSSDLHHGTLFDTKLNDEIDQRIKTGLAAESDGGEQAMAVPLDVTRQTIALLNELQKSVAETGSQLLAERVPTGGMQAVAAPPAEKSSQNGENGETEDGLLSDRRARSPRAFAGPVFPGAENLNPQQGSIKLGTASVKQNAAVTPAESPPAASPDQSALDTGDLPSITEAAPTKPFPSTMPAPAPAPASSEVAQPEETALLAVESIPAVAPDTVPIAESEVAQMPEPPPPAEFQDVPSTHATVAPVEVQPLPPVDSAADRSADRRRMIATVPTAFIAGFIVIILLTFLYVLTSVHQP